MPLEFGTKLPNLSPLGGREPLVEMARAAERLGYDVLWVSDHVVIPDTISRCYPYSETGEFIYPSTFIAGDALISLAVAAGCTERIMLGTAVLVAPLRNPLLTAKMVATLDMLSAGRLRLGVGPGWLKEEMEILGGVDYRQRGRMTDEWIRIFRRCWADDLPGYEGDFYSFPPVHFRPRPDKPIPIWVGGKSRAALKRTGVLGDGWVGPPVSVDELKEVVATVKTHAAAAGRDPDAIRFATTLYTEVLDRRGPEPADDLVGTPEQIAERLDLLAAAGLDHIEIRLRSMRDEGSDRASLDRTLDAMTAFATEVMPLLRGRPG